MKSGLALFEILHTHNLQNPFPNDENELVFEIHKCKCEEYQLCILASRFQILLLRADDPFVLQERFSQLLPDQRTSRKIHLFLKLVDAPRKDLLCRKVFLDSTFFRVNTAAGIPVLSRK